MAYVPNLRFPDYFNKYVNTSLSLVLSRVSNPVEVDLTTEYYQIGIRSHGKGLFYKDKETGKEIGNKRIFWIEPDCLIVNIVFAWERAVAKTTNKEIGMVASHRFPMYKVKNSSLDYLLYYLKTDKGKELLELSSPGGAGRNKTLNQLEFLNSKLYLPSIEEQKKVAYFLALIDNRIELQNKIIEDLELQRSSIIDYLYNYNGGNEYKFKNLYTKAKEGGTPSTSVVSYYENGEIPFIKIDDLNNKYINHNKSYITEEGMQNSSAWLIPENSVILSNGATMGSVSINTYPITTKQGILGIVPSKLVNYEYLYYLLNTTVFKKSLKQITTKGTMECAYIKDIDNIVLKLPTLDVQLKSVKVLDYLDRQLTAEDNLLNKYKLQKNHLLQNLFI